MIILLEAQKESSDEFEGQFEAIYDPNDQPFRDDHESSQVWGSRNNNKP